MINENHYHRLADAIRLMAIARKQELPARQILLSILDSSRLLIPFTQICLLHLDKQLDNQLDNQRWHVLACMPENLNATPAVLAVQTRFEKADEFYASPVFVLPPMGESSHSWFVLPLSKEGDPPKVFVAQVEPDESEKILTERLIWETFAAQASILLDWVDLRSQMAGSLQREQRLAEMMRIITSEVELPLILQNVVQTAVEILDADCGVLGLIDPSGGWVEYAYLHNLPQMLSERRALRGSGMAWQIIHFGQVVRVADYAAQTFAQPEWVKTGIHAAVGAPVNAGEDHLGVLILFQINPEKLFSQEAEGLVETIGRQAGIAIQNARLFDRERRRADEFEALRTTLTEMSSELELPRLFNSILRRAIQLMLVSAGELGLVADDGAHYQVVSRANIQDARNKAELSLGEDLLGKVLLSRQPLLINDYSNWKERSLRLENGLPVAALGVPMFASGKLLGAIMVISDQGGRFFNDEDMNLLTLFAQQAAIAIENAHLYAEAQRLAITDALTGIYNRRHFFHLARREVDRSMRYGQPLALIMLDIDRFKAINDTYGHLVGDQVLREVAQFCAQLLRDVDIIARYGGEEFAVLLPNTTAAGARLVAGRLHENIENLRVQADDVIVQVTISLGVVQIGPDCETLENLLRCADQALYQAKAAGRNQVFLLDQSG